MLHCSSSNAFAWVVVLVDLITPAIPDGSRIAGVVIGWDFFATEVGKDIVTIYAPNNTSPDGFNASAPWATISGVPGQNAFVVSSCPCSVFRNRFC